MVVGASVAGLAAARELADRGCTVTLVDADGIGPAGDPEDAFARAPRPGTPQARQSHGFLGRLRCILRDRHPDLLQELLAAGVRELDPIDRPPPELRGRLSRQPGDDDLVVLAARRTTFEWALRRAVLRNPRVRLVSGVRVERLIASGKAMPVVAGVEGRAPEGVVEILGTLVIDASGRRSRAPLWLREIQARPPAEVRESSGIVYYTKFYRLRPGATEPEGGGGPALADYDWIKFAVFPADRGTFSITFAVPLALRELKVLARDVAFDAAVRCFPGLAAWAEAGEPITGVQPMGGLENRLRRFVRRGAPLAVGLFVIGDAAYCTNPLYGRGCAQAFLHAHLLGQALDACPYDLEGAARRLDREARRTIEPFCRASIIADRDAVRRARGEAPRTIQERLWSLFLQGGVVPAMRRDPVVYRAFLRMFNMLETPEEAFTRVEVLLRAGRSLIEGRGRPLHGWEPPPDREAFLAACRRA